MGVSPFTVIHIKSCAHTYCTAIRSQASNRWKINTINHKTNSKAEVGFCCQLNLGLTRKCDPGKALWDFQMEIQKLGMSWAAILLLQDYFAFLTKGGESPNVTVGMGQRSHPTVWVPQLGCWGNMETYYCYYSSTK